MTSSVSNYGISKEARVNGEQCFFLALSVAAVAGQYSMVQLLNPAASGKNLVVTSGRFIGATTELNGMMLRSHATALSTSFTPINKFIGGAAPVGQVWYQQAAAHVGTGVCAFYCTANVEIKFSDALDFPLVIQPGAGLVVAHNVPNSGMGLAVSWFESNA